MCLRKSPGAGGVSGAVLLLFFALGACAQGMYGFDGGLGKSTAANSAYTPAFSGYYLHKLSRTFYLGGALSYERYSFMHEYNPSGPAYGDILSIKQRSSYLFFTPKVDVGIGYRKYWHAFFSFGPGMLLSGRQVTYTYESYYTTPPLSIAHDTTGSATTRDLPVLISRYNIGVSRRIPTMRYWNIMVGASYSFIPNNLTTQGPALRTNYFAFTIGIMHKYPMVMVEY